MGAILKSDSGL